jgi:lipoate---protein ligase
MIALAGRELLVYFDRSEDPVENLRREDELFQQVERGALPELVRFWVNSECLVRGKVKAARYGWYNEELAERMGVRVVERSTGGGVVYHDKGNLNWSFIARTNGAFLAPTATFDRTSKYMLRALESLGVRATFSAPNRIDVSGLKVSGMAARSTHRALLVHGTLLLNSNLEKLNMLCIPPAGCPAVANVNQWANGIDAPRVAAAFVSALKDSGFRVTAAGTGEDRQ